MARRLYVTVDTEVDKAPDWAISDPVSFSSVTHGIRHLLSPLFDAYGVRPTYLLSPEVIEEPASVDVLAGLGDRAELGTHLHAEFVAPDRRLPAAAMAGARADAMQREWPRDVEAQKLATLTEGFEAAFGYRPRSFRAGRFGLGPHTLELLAGLGYRVDSSVTPGLRWPCPGGGHVDYRGWTTEPRWLRVGGGTILELPLSIWPATGLATWADRLPDRLEGVARRALRPLAGFRWLRPSWCSPRELRAAVRHSHEPDLVLMFHSVEVVPGASPYSADAGAAARVLASLEAVLECCAEEGFSFPGLADAACEA